MAKRKRTTQAGVNATIEGGDVQGIVGAQQVFVEKQIFFSSSPAVEDGDNAQVGSKQDVATLPVWHVPYPRNPHFTGRLEVIARIEEDLQSGQVAAVTQAIAGLGGIGKTQLALEYCYRQTASYKVVWWIRAESKETRMADLAALAKRLQLGSTDEFNLSDSVRAVVEWLNRTPGWLLIFDNVEHPDDLEDLLPAAGRGHILITSRHASWGAWAKTVSLNVWTSQESTQYLLKRTGERDTEANEHWRQLLGNCRWRLSRPPRTSKKAKLEFRVMQNCLHSTKFAYSTGAPHNSQVLSGQLQRSGTSPFRLSSGPLRGRSPCSSSVHSWGPIAFPNRK